MSAIGLAVKVSGPMFRSIGQACSAFADRHVVFLQGSESARGFARNATLIDDYGRPKGLKNLGDAGWQAIRETIAARIKALAEAIFVALTIIS
ncbi:MAG: hypothetical protein RQ741_04710 [Wenzhouxiangellaceae bacterium]|nr:hypothetical protein [Wenzhouxiangellaceae bacterium]